MGMLRAAWCVPFPSEGAGGFRTILQNVVALRSLGYTCDLYFAPSPERIFDIDAIRRNLSEWYGFVPEGLYFADRLRGSYDVSIATAWDTASFVADSSCARKLYFVQDYEPWFMPMGDLRVDAKQSYQLGLQPITIGRWLANRMSEESGLPVPCCDFGANPTVYRELESVSREHAICAICQPEKPRRMTNLLLNSIRTILEVDPSLTIYLYGSNEGQLPLFPQVRNLGVISVEECNLLYNKCLCGIALSASNPSRIPFEMMAAGLPVVDLYGENNLYDYPTDAVTLAQPTAEGIASAVTSLLVDEPRRRRARAKGMSWMRGRTVEEESLSFARGVDEFVRTGAFSGGRVYERQARQSPEPVRDECASLMRSRRARFRLNSLVQQLPIDARSMDVDVCVDYCVPDGSTFKLAVWSGFSQEDLRWIRLDPGAGGHFRAQNVKFDRAVSDEPLRYVIHLYRDDADGSSHFQSGFSLRIQPKKGERSRHLEIREDTVGFSLKFKKMFTLLG